MRGSKSKLFPLALGVLLALGISGCSGSDSSDTTIGNGRSNLAPSNSEGKKKDGTLGGPGLTVLEGGPIITVQQDEKLPDTNKEGSTTPQSDTGTTTHTISTSAEISTSRDADEYKRNEARNIVDHSKEDQPLAGCGEPTKTVKTKCGQVTQTKCGVTEQPKCGQSEQTPVATPEPKKDPVVLPAQPNLPNDQPEQATETVEAETEEDSSKKTWISNDDALAMGFTQSYNFKQPNYTKPVAHLDVLFVVDTTAYLKQARQKVAEEFDAFLAGMDRKTIESINVGVIAAHSVDAVDGGDTFGRPYNYQVPGKMETDPKRIDVDLNFTRNAIDALDLKMQRIPEDPTTDGGQLGLASFYQALADGNRKHLQTDFLLRRNAALLVIFVSDENDICYNYKDGDKRNNNFQKANLREDSAKAKYCNGVTPQAIAQRLKTVKKEMPVILSAIVHKKEQAFKGEAELGYGYLDLLNVDSHSFSSRAIEFSKDSYIEDFLLLAVDTREAMVLEEKLENVFYIQNAKGLNPEKLAVFIDGQQVDAGSLKVESYDGRDDVFKVTVPKDMVGTFNSNVQVFF